MYAVREFLDDEEARKLKVGFGKREFKISPFILFVFDEGPRIY